MSSHESGEPRRASDAVQRPTSDAAGRPPLQAAPDFGALQCPIPNSEYPAVLLAHGGGGRLTQSLIERMFVRAFANPALEALHDGALLERPAGRVAFSTDSFVVSPRVFPGGDIGSLAVHGTVNDLAMCGARPIALSAGFIIEEGLPMEELWRYTSSMRDAARAVGVPIVTGDTKVVDRGKGDGLYINTAGIGVVPDGVEIAPARAAAGDVVIVSGDIGVHGIVIMAVREGIELETKLESDSAPLHELTSLLIDAVGPALHVLRDPTRGGVASALNEIAASARVGMLLQESAIPVREEVRAACEILGFDPLYVANEGRLIAIVARDAAERALAALRAHPLGRGAALIGELTAEHPGRVHLRSRIGGTRIVDMLSGEQLPRIC